MPEAIDKFRTAHADNASKQVGLHIGQGFLPFATDQAGRGAVTEIMLLPHDLSSWQPLQDLDPDSPTFGQSYFLPDFDTPGDPTKIIR